MTHALSSADISIFSPKNSNFFISRNADIDCVLTYKTGCNFDDVKIGYSRPS